MELGRGATLPLVGTMALSLVGDVILHQPGSAEWRAQLEQVHRLKVNHHQAGAATAPPAQCSLTIRFYIERLPNITSILTFATPGWKLYYLHFTGKQTAVLRGEVICPRLQWPRT